MTEAGAGCARVFAGERVAASRFQRSCRPAARRVSTTAPATARSVRVQLTKTVSGALIRESIACRRERFGLAYRDCAILAAASACGCDVVYSEDLSHEQDYDGLRVVNPFA